MHFPGKCSDSTDRTRYCGPRRCQPTAVSANSGVRSDLRCPTLDEVNAVSIPAGWLNPRAFEYRRDCAAAILGDPLPVLNRCLRNYRITVRP